MMPERLVLIRHGLSELNVLNKKLKKENLPFPKEFHDIPDREYRLAKEGVLQAKATGKWLKKEYGGFHFGPYFHERSVVICSDFVRAKETCYHVLNSAGFDKSEIIIDPLVGERNWGAFHLVDSSEQIAYLRKLKKRDPLFFPMPDGETISETRNRTRTLLERCSRQFEDKNVFVITHGEFIESLISEVFHFRTEQHVSFFESDLGDIKNCQVFEIRSIDGKFKLFRTSNPYLKEFGDWKEIPKSKVKIEDLLKEIDQYKHIIK